MHYKLKVVTLAVGMGFASSATALAQSPMPMGSMAPAGAAPMPMASTGPSMTVKLGAQNGSGETATALITPVAGGVNVSVKTAGGPATAQPIHIHKGTCATLDPKPTYPLTTVMDGSSLTFVKGVSPADLLASPYAINIHKSPTEAAIYVACGNIAK
jgi:hypothetical protein